MSGFEVFNILNLRESYFEIDNSKIKNTKKLLFQRNFYYGQIISYFLPVLNIYKDDLNNRDFDSPWNILVFTCS